MYMQEMITHLPLCCVAPRNANEKLKVCVVGGGDGGVLREVTRHACVGEVHIAEIDAEVIRVAKAYFPSLSIGFDDERVQVHITDGAAFIANHENHFDCVIVDSSDPVGPAAALFEKDFFVAVHRSLRPGGVACTQAESIWLHLDLIKGIRATAADVFGDANVAYAAASVPTYPSGQIGFMLCKKQEKDDDASSSSSSSAAANFKPMRDVPSEADDRRTELMYYSRETHDAAFVLPRFAAAALAPTAS